MRPVRRLLSAALIAGALIAVSGCSAGAEPPTLPVASGASAAQTYTAVLWDERDDPPSTLPFAYAGDTTAREILNALGEMLRADWDLLSAEISDSEAHMVFGENSALASAGSEAELRGLVESIRQTVQENYGRDKSVFLTVGAGMTRFGVDLTGSSPLDRGTPNAPEVRDGELTLADAETYAINLTYGMLGDTSVALTTRFNQIIAIEDTSYYDISVSSMSDPDSIMRRFAISFDGETALMYNAVTDSFEYF